jgi:tRNA A37 threonylcarbamoyltransferase TsaD
VEVDGETLKNLGDQDLLILAALVKNQDTNMAYSGIQSFVAQWNKQVKVLPENQECA